MDKSTFLKVGEFIFYTLSIYACYITSGVYHEKIIKHAYISDVDQTTANFDASIVFTFFPPLICTLLGWAIREFMRRQQGQAPVQIPARNAVICSAIINISMLTYNKAVQVASFPAVVMIKSCSLLSVILVALFCSKVKDKNLKLGKGKIVIGVLVAVGIFLFNYFKQTESTSNNNPVGWLGSGLLLISLIGDGLLPDFQAEIKAEFKPGVIDMYYSINKYTCLIALGYATIGQQLFYIFTFIFEHSELQKDLFLFSVLNALGQLIIYRMIKLFKQHIPPFVIATRKCFTVIVNILHFGHTINQQQLMGMILVFSAIILEVYTNYREKVAKELANKEIDMNQKVRDTIQPDSERLHSREEIPEEERQQEQQKVEEDRDEEAVIASKMIDT